MIRTLLRCLLLLAMGCALAACGARRPNLYAEASVPFQMVAADAKLPPAERSIPWADRTLVARVRFRAEPLRGESLPGGSTPGLYAAEARLKARTEAIDDLARQVGALEAGDRVAGSDAAPTLERLAAREPALARAIEVELTAPDRERLIQENAQTGDTVLERRLPLEVLARAVLAVGGGFQAAQLDTQATAATTATRKAYESLALQIRGETFPDGQTMAEWAAAGPRRTAALERLVRNARVLRSEPVQTPEGGYEWYVELEVLRRDLDALQDLDADLPEERPIRR